MYQVQHTWQFGLSLFVFFISSSCLNSHWGEVNNSLFPQTFVNKVIDYKLVKDDKDKRDNLKFQAFIWWIDNKEIVVGLPVDQDIVCNWWASGVDAVTCLEVFVCWGTGTGPLFGAAGADSLIQKLVCYMAGNTGTVLCGSWSAACLEMQKLVWWCGI